MGTMTQLTASLKLSRIITVLHCLVSDSNVMLTADSMRQNKKKWVIKSGKFKDSGSPVRTMTKEEKNLLQGVVDDVHSQFVQAIVNGRDLPENDVRKIADGSVFTGKRALELKLVDQLGGLEDSIEWMKKALHLKNRPKIVQKKEKTHANT